MSDLRSQLHKEARNNILQYALLRWESAAVIALTLIVYFLAPGPLGLPGELWLLLGLAGLGLLVYSSLTDAEANARVLLTVFQERFNPARIQDSSLRTEVEEALEYQRRIEMQVRAQPAGLIRDRLEDAANQLSDWISNIYQLALRVDAYRADDLLARERASLPQELETLQTRRQREQNSSVQRQLDQVLESKGAQWQTLRELDTRMRQAQLQMDQSTTALATIYGQIQLLNAESINRGGAERLRSDIQEQVKRIDDLVVSLNEVYTYQHDSRPNLPSADNAS